MDGRALVTEEQWHKPLVGNYRYGQRVVVVGLPEPAVDLESVGSTNPMPVDSDTASLDAFPTNVAIYNPLNCVDFMLRYRLMWALPYLGALALLLAGALNIFLILPRATRSSRWPAFLR